MAENSNIEWCDHTYNPWRGCARVSPGCLHCYAERMSVRNPKVLGSWGPQGSRVLASDSQWTSPIRWDRQHALWDYWDRNQRVFCASLADVFEDWTGQMTDSRGSKLWLDFPESATQGVAKPFPADSQPQGAFPYQLDHARSRLWRLIRSTPHLNWILLTKRPENIARMMPQGSWPNVWLGTSVESQEWVWRLDALQESAQKIHVPVLFCSAEPLIGPLDLTGVLGPTGINWLIIGGESGARDKVRPMQLPWVRDLLNQCRQANIPPFVKQLGARYLIPIGRLTSEMFLEPHLKDRKGGSQAEWPQDLRVREFPSKP